MADTAELVCFDELFALEFGWFWNVGEPCYIFTPAKAPASRVPELSRTLWAPRGDGDPDFARIACLDCKVVLPLGSFWSAAGSPARYIVAMGGTPAFEDVELNRALWKFLADHVYHDVHAIGRRSPLAAALDQPEFVVIGGGREGVDLSVRGYLGDWPG